MSASHDSPTSQGAGRAAARHAQFRDPGRQPTSSNSSSPFNPCGLMTRPTPRRSSGAPTDRSPACQPASPWPLGDFKRLRSTWFISSMAPWLRHSAHCPKSIAVFVSRGELLDIYRSLMSTVSGARRHDFAETPAGPSSAQRRRRPRQPRSGICGGCLRDRLTRR